MFKCSKILISKRKLYHLRNQSAIEFQQGDFTLPEGKPIRYSFSRLKNATPFGLKKILANKKSEVRIAWLTGRKIMGQFPASPFRKQVLFKNG